MKQNITLIKEKIKPNLERFLQNLKHILFRYVFKCFPILIIAAVFLIVAYYLIFPSRGYFHSDCTDTMVWAAASYESGKIFDPDCDYACLLPFGGSLLMIPFYGLFGFSMTTHIIGMSLFLVIFSVALFFLIREVKWSMGWTAIMFTAIMLTVSASDKLREIFWGHVIYYSLGILFIFVGLLIYFKLCNERENSQLSSKSKRIKIIVLTSLIFIWFFLCATNKLMTITIFSIPVIGAILLENILDTDKKKNTILFSGIILAVMIIATVGGYIVSTIAAGDIVGSYADAYSDFSNPNEWLDNFHKIPISWLTLIGVDIHDGDPIMSFDGVINLIKIVFALLLAFIPLISLLFYNKIKEKFIRIIILVHFIASALILMGFIFGKLSAAQWRLSPILCTSVMASVSFVKWVCDNKTFKIMGVLLLVPQLCVCLSVASVMCKMPYDYGQNEKLYAVADFLVENELDYGYATFWNANSVTAISNSAVKVKSVNDLNEYQPTIYRYQTRKQWYKPADDQQKFFLLLTQWEYDNIQTLENPILEKEHYVLKCEDYVILVFSKDII